MSNNEVGRKGFAQVFLYYYLIYSILNWDGKRILIVPFITSTLGSDDEWDLTAKVTIFLCSYTSNFALLIPLQRHFSLRGTD